MTQAFDRALGQVSGTWASIFYEHVSVAKPNTVITLPAFSEISVMRLTVKQFGSIADSYMMGYFSTDGGATYPAAAGQYNNTIMTSGTASNTVSVIPNAQETFGRIAFAGATGAAAISETLIVNDAAIQFLSNAGGQHSVNGSQISLTKGYMRLVTGPATHLKLQTLNGNIAAKTEIILEGLMK